MKIVVNTSNMEKANEISERVEDSLKQYFHQSHILIQVEPSEEKNQSESDNIPPVSLFSRNFSN